MNISRNKAIAFGAAFLLIVACSLRVYAAATGPQVVETEWTQRCDDVKDKDGKVTGKHCEVFKTLTLAGEQKSRVAEFAAGFADDKETDSARGGVILPLGVLLEDIAMKIDDNKPFKFRIQYCTQAGCVAFINMNKDLLDQMKKGSVIHFYFKSMAGGDVDLKLNLAGFSKALKQLQ